MPRKPRTDSEIERHILDIGAEKAIRELELATCASPRIAGTSLTRVLVDQTMAGVLGLGDRPELGVDSLAWCLGLGVISEPKEFFYSWTIIGAFVKAWKVKIK